MFHPPSDIGNTKNASDSMCLVASLTYRWEVAQSAPGAGRWSRTSIHSLSHTYKTTSITFKIMTYLQTIPSLLSCYNKTNEFKAARERKQMKKKLLIIISLLSIIIVFRIIRDVNAVEIVQSHQAEALSSETLSDEIVVKKIDINSIEDPVFKNTILDTEEADNGLFAFSFSQENKYYILFNGLEKAYSNIEFSFENQNITVSYNSEAIEEENQMKALYVIERQNRDSYDNILLKNNGKEDAFADLFISK